jgi:hypothetical protein
MNTKIILPVVLVIVIGTISLVFVVPQQLYAYNKYGFANQEQCVNITKLEYQGGFFDNATFAKLIGMCEHKSAATNATTSSSNATVS